MLKYLLPLFLVLASPAFAQTGFGITPQNTSTQSMSVTTSSSSITIDTKPGTTVVVMNTGSNTAYVTTSATATTTGFPIPAGYSVVMNITPGATLSAITASSSTTLLVGKGSGSLALAGGGSGGGGGGGGAVTIADGADATQGAQADATCGTATGTCTVVSLLKYLNTAVGSAIPAGTNLIGDVNLRQGGTALSTTNGAYFNQLQGNAVLSATNPSFTRPTDGTNARVFDPCQVVAKSYKAFSQTATAVLVTGAASKKTYVCSMSIIAGAAEIFNLTAGTGSTCGTNAVAVMGSTTAANGLSLAANGGLTFGNGAASLAATTVNQDDLCLQQSGSNRLSGSITYVQL